MKTTFTVLGAVLLLGVAILAGLHFFLQHGLARAMRAVVLPRLKAETGIDAQVEALSINLPGGRLHLKGVAVANPPGFGSGPLASIGRVDLEVDVRTLLRRGPVVFRNVEVQDLLLNIIRNEEGLTNLAKLQEGIPAPPEPSPAEPDPEAPTTPKPLPEVLIESLRCGAKVRYLDQRLKQLDMTLDLAVRGVRISTLSDPSAPWGDLALDGALGGDRTSFVTDLRLRLAPLADPKAPSFDLDGKVLEIDPRLLDEAYKRLGIRSAPFGVEPAIRCRGGRFEDSALALELRDIVFEDKLARRLGGLGSIGALRFVVPVKGTIEKPEVDLLSALKGAIGGNAGGLLDAWLKGAAGREAGLGEEPATLSEAAVELLGAKVGEIGRSETAKKVLKELAEGSSSRTNAAAPSTSDILVDILGEKVEEIGGNEALKQDLKDLGRKLFGR